MEITTHDKNSNLASVDDADAGLLRLWLHGRSKHTQRAYREEMARFVAFCAKRLADVTLGDVQDYATHLDTLPLAPGTRRRALAAIKSLFSFGCKLGVLRVDVARPVRLPKVPNDLAERILSEEEVLRILAAPTDPRDAALLSVLFYGGLRVSEAVGLRWRNVIARATAGQITVFGKGGKTRVVLLPLITWAALRDWRLAMPASVADPVFPGRRPGTALSSSQAWRIVKAMTVRAGVDKPVSPHFFRHAHASLALDGGAPVHLVQATLGHSSLETTSRYVHARPNESSGGYLK